MRCSAIVWPTSGSTLELGARIRKNHAPRQPSAGRRTSAQAVAASSVTTTRPCHHTSATDRASQVP